MLPAELSSLQQWSERIISEFTQCPGLRLTSAQAARLWALPQEHAEAILLDLADRGVLTRNARGNFVKRGGCPGCE